MVGYSNWKQPVYVGFDPKMTKELPENVMTHLHDITCTSDRVGQKGLWKVKKNTSSYEKDSLFLC